MNITVIIGSIKNKETKKRDPFIILGDFDDRQNFVSCLNQDFDPEYYDYRTIKFADETFVPIHKGTIISLECLQEDLGELEDKYKVSLEEAISIIEGYAGNGFAQWLEKTKELLKEKV